MKTLISALLLVSTGALATEMDATEALRQTLPIGFYSGETTDGQLCKVSVQKGPRGVNVTVASNGKAKSHETLNGSDYRWNPGQRLFYSSQISRTSNGQKVDFVRTIAVKETTQYVVVGNILRSNDGTNESVLECVVDL